MQKNFYVHYIFGMSFKSTLEKNLIKFGKNNSPTVVAMGIAAAKGIFRPMFTMSDKKESYETKRYTALREGLTELIAIPVYYLSGVVTSQIAKKLAVPKNFMPKNLYEKYKSGQKTPEVAKAYKQAEKIAKENLPKIKISAAFAGVCFAALFAIPYICSKTIKPIMNYLNKNRPQQEENKIIPQTPITPVKSQPKPQIYHTFNNSSYGMKVGGV